MENEIKTYRDLVLSQAPGAVNFGLQLLWILDWVNNHYSFKYFLRIDDDYFIRLNKLMYELASGQRPKQTLQWGWLHCELPGRVYKKYCVKSKLQIFGYQLMQYKHVFSIVTPLK